LIDKNSTAKAFIKSIAQAFMPGFTMNGCEAPAPPMGLPQGIPSVGGGKITDQLFPGYKKFDFMDRR
jgi:hypothetical protein